MVNGSRMMWLNRKWFRMMQRLVMGQRGWNMGNGYPLVFDVSMVAVVVGGVGDDLNAAIGQGHSVFSRGLVTVPDFGVGKVFTCVFVVDGISKGVVRRTLK